MGGYGRSCQAGVVTGRLTQHAASRMVPQSEVWEALQRTIWARKWCVICTALTALHSRLAICASSGLRRPSTPALFTPARWCRPLVRSGQCGCGPEPRTAALRSAQPCRLCLWILRQLWAATQMEGVAATGRTCCRRSQ